MNALLGRLHRRLRGEGRRLALAGERWVDVEAYRLAAALAFYALLSLMPMLLLALGILDAVIGDSSHARQQTVEWFDVSQSPKVREVLGGALSELRIGPSGTVWGVVIGALGALLGASGVFAELDTALNRTFRSERPAGSFRALLHEFFQDRLWAFVFVVLTSLLVFSAAVTGTFWDAAERAEVGPPIVLRAASGVVTLGATTLALAASYRYVPERWVGWKSALQGGFVAAALLGVVRIPFGWLVVHLMDYAAYGVIGAVLLLVTWMWVSALAILYGASVAAIASEAHDDPVSSSYRKSARPRFVSPSALVPRPSPGAGPVSARSITGEATGS